MRRLAWLVALSIVVLVDGRSVDAVTSGTTILSSDLTPGAEFGWLVRLDDGDGGRGRCSGSLIDTEWVLTAAHCVGEASSRAFIGNSTVPVAIDRVEVLGQFDAALLHLSVPSFVPTVGLAGLSAVPPTNASVTIAGWGVNDTGNPATEPDRGTMLVAGVDLPWLNLEPDPSAPCGGDSGGPVTMRSITGETLLIGVLSQGDPHCKDYGLAVSHLAIVDLVHGVIAPDLTAPVVTSGTVRTPIDEPVAVPIEFSDPGGEAMTFADIVSSETTHGSVTACAAEAPPTTCTFVPDPGFIGLAGLTYVVSDGRNQTTASWVIEVFDVPSVVLSPAVVDEPAESPHLVVLDVQLVGPVSGPVTVDIKADGGTATAGQDYRTTAIRVVLSDHRRSSTFRILVLPDSESERDETVVFRVAASPGVRVRAPQPAVTIVGDLPPLNQPPVVRSGTLATVMDVAVNIPLQFSDPDGTPLTLEENIVGSTVEHGTITGFGQDAQGLFAVFQPDAGFVGTASFSYQVSDGIDTTTGTWTIIVSAQ